MGLTPVKLFWPLATCQSSVNSSTVRLRILEASPMDDCPVTGQSPQGFRRNPDPAIDPDYGLAGKPLSAPQT